MNSYKIEHGLGLLGVGAQHLLKFATDAAKNGVKPLDIVKLRHELSYLAYIVEAIDTQLDAEKATTTDAFIKKVLRPGEVDLNTNGDKQNEEY